MATIVVVGGGLAGLASAWRLTRQGHRVRVLERADEVGGRARSVVRRTRRGTRQRLDTGCPAVVPGQRRVLALAREAGVLGRLRPRAFGRDARWQDDAWIAASRRDVLDLTRLPEGPRHALRAALDFQRPARLFPAECATAQLVLRAATADALGWWPAAPEPWEGPVHAALRATLPQTAPHAFAGGMSTLCDAIARSLDVVRGCDVRRVETDSEGVALVYRVEGGGERRERADAAVVAVPAPRVAALCPKLTPEERGFFESARSRPSLVVHLVFAEGPQIGSRSLVLPPESGLELASLHVEHSGAAPSSAGVLRAQLTTPAAERMFRASDASIADLVVENLAYAPPPVGELRPLDFAVWRHADGVPRFDADHARRLARFGDRLERSPRLAFAGDALGGPSLDGAVASGLRAADALARELAGR